VTQNGIRALFKTLRTANVRGAPDVSTAELRRDVLRLWAARLKTVTDAEAAAALDSYMDDPQACRFWPQPAELKARVPKRPAPKQLTGEAIPPEVLEAARKLRSDIDSDQVEAYYPERCICCKSQLPAHWEGCPRAWLDEVLGAA
jgi:hypothetical protein